MMMLPQELLTGAVAYTNLLRSHTTAIGLTVADTDDDDLEKAIVTYQCRI